MKDPLCLKKAPTDRPQALEEGREGRLFFPCSSRRRKEKKRASCPLPCEGRGESEHCILSSKKKKGKSSALGGKRPSPAVSAKGLSFDQKGGGRGGGKAVTSLKTEGRKGRYLLVSWKKPRGSLALVA